MLLKAKQIIGLPVYTLVNGKKLQNEIKDVVYDPTTNQIEALLLQDSGVFSDAKLILFHDIHSLGHDAVLIENEGKVKKSGDVKQTIARIAKGDNYLTTDKVIAEDGTDLGRISDLHFDSKTGKVEEFEVSQGAFKNVSSGKKAIKNADIITVGENAMIVSSYTQAKLEKQAEQQGITGALHQAQQQTPTLIEQVKQKTQEFADRTREFVQEKREDPELHRRLEEARARASQATESLQEKAKGAKTTLQQRVERGKEQEMKNKINNAVGKYVTINVLSSNDEMLAKRGDMITYQLIEQAEKNNILDQVLSHTADQPLQATQSQQLQNQQVGAHAPLAEEIRAHVTDEGLIIERVEEHVVIPNKALYAQGLVSGILGGRSKHPREKTSRTTKKSKAKATKGK